MGNPYIGDQKQQAQMASGIGNQFKDAGESAYGQYQQYRPQADNAISGLASLLSKRTYAPTSQETASFVNQNTGNMQDAYNRQMEQLRNQIPNGGGDSFTAGQGTIYASQLARALGGAQNDASNYYNQRAVDAANQLQQLLSGNAQLGYGNAMGAYGNAQSAYGNAGGMYGNMANAWQQQENHKMDRWTNLLSGALQTGASLYGMGGMGRGGGGGGGSQGGYVGGGFYTPDGAYFQNQGPK